MELDTVRIRGICLGEVFDDFGVHRKGGKRRRRFTRLAVNAEIAGTG